MSALPPLSDRYAPIRLVGEGATGAVYEVEDRLLGGRVALKAVRANLSVHARFRARFAHEVALSARVSHPRVVPVLDHGALQDGRPYVVLALADRGSLHDRLRAGLPLSEALRLTDQALDALAHLHARGYLHQDLKPGNLLLHGEGARVGLWVADLGVAEALSALAVDRRGISGTPVWMAPEQLEARNQELGPWTDLYAIGLILAAMLGALPPEELAARNPAELLERRHRLSVRLRPELPAGLGEVLSVLLDPEPRQRYDRAADARRALRDSVGELPPELRLAELPRGAMATTSRTSFPTDFLPQGQAPIVAPRAASRVAIRWHRVQPDPMPTRVPPLPAPDPRTRASLGLLALREPPLVCRSELRQRLWTLATAVARSGAPQIALVIGASGAGKSRLVESIAETLDQHGYMEIVTLRYHLPAGDLDGYRGAVRELLAPWNETRGQTEERLTRWLARDWQQTQDAVAHEAAALARWCGSLREGEAPVHSAAGLSYLYRYLDARAWRSGAALVLDDAHLAQAPGDGLAICEALLRRTVGQRPVFAMATLSAEAVASNPALAAQVDDLVALGAVRVDVPRLSAEEIRGLLVEAASLEPGLANELAPRCHGSPSFAVLLLRELAASDALTLRPDGSFGLGPGAHRQIVPPDVESLAERRVDGALATATDPSAAEETLMLLALAGQDPPTLVIRAAAPTGGLEALLATGLVRQRGWRLEFEHDEVRRAAWRLAESSPTTPDLHRRLAEAWAALGRRTGADVDSPHGLHRLHADQPVEALRPLLRAARTALVEGRPAAALDAAHFATVAADRLGGVQERYEARCLQVEALLDLERADDAIGLVNQTRKLPRLSDHDNAHLQVLLARAAIARGSLAQAWKLLEMAEACYTLLRDRAGHADTTAGFARLYRLLGEQDEAVRRYQQLLELKPGDLRVEVEARKEIIECCIALGQASGLEREVGRMTLAAQRSGDTRSIASATYAAGLLRSHHGQLAEAEAHLRTARALAATLGADVLDLLCQQRLGAVMAARQDDQAAIQVFDDAARFAEDRGWGDSAAVTHLQIALIALRRGLERRVAHETDRANHLLQGWPQHWAWALVGVLRALTAARAGDAAATDAWWQVAWERLSGRLATAEFGLALQLLAGIATRRGWGHIAQQARVMSRQVIGTSLLPDDDTPDDHERPPTRSAAQGDDAMSRTRPAPSPLPPVEDMPPSRGRAGTTWLPEDDEDEPSEPPAPAEEPPRRASRGGAVFLPEVDISTEEVPTRRR